jgi:hypothetical protein
VGCSEETEKTMDPRRRVHMRCWREYTKFIGQVLLLFTIGTTVATSDESKLFVIIDVKNPWTIVVREIQSPDYTSWLKVLSSATNGLQHLYLDRYDWSSGVTGDKGGEAPVDIDQVRLFLSSTSEVTRCLQASWKGRIGELIHDGAEIRLRHWLAISKGMTNCGSDETMGYPIRWGYLLPSKTKGRFVSFGEPWSRLPLEEKIGIYSTRLQSKRMGEFMVPLGREEVAFEVAESNGIRRFRFAGDIFVDCLSTSNMNNWLEIRTNNWNDPGNWHVSEGGGTAISTLRPKVVEHMRQTGLTTMKELARTGEELRIEKKWEKTEMKCIVVVHIVEIRVGGVLRPNDIFNEESRTNDVLKDYRGYRTQREDPKSQPYFNTIEI